MSHFVAGSLAEAQEAWNQSCWQAASAAGPDMPKSKRGVSTTSPFLEPSSFDGLLLKAWLHAEEGSAADASSRRRGRSRGTRRSEDALAYLDSAFEIIRLDLRHDAEAGLLPETDSLAQLHVLREAYKRMKPASNPIKRVGAAAAASAPAVTAAGSSSPSGISVLELPMIAANDVGTPIELPVLQLGKLSAFSKPKILQEQTAVSLASGLQLLQAQSAHGTQNAREDALQQLCRCAQAAAAGANRNLVAKLLQRLQAASSSRKAGSWSSICSLLRIQASVGAHNGSSSNHLRGIDNVSAASEDVLQLFKGLKALRRDSAGLGSPSKQQQAAYEWPGDLACQGLLLLYAWLEGHGSNDAMADQLQAEGAVDQIASCSEQAMHVAYNDELDAVQTTAAAVVGRVSLVSKIQYSTAHEAIDRCPASGSAWLTYANWLHTHAQLLTGQIAQARAHDEPSGAMDAATISHMVAVDYAHALALGFSNQQPPSNLSILLRILHNAEASLQALTSTQHGSFSRVAQSVAEAVIGPHSSQGSTVSEAASAAEDGSCEPKASARLRSLEAAVAAVPLKEWCASLPQLFSKLMTSQKLMRSLVKKLLQRLVDAAPHIVLYPLLGMLQTSGAAPSTDPSAS